MYSIRINKPSTFFSASPDIFIWDSDWEPFYWHDNKERHINFNLPIGQYYSNVKVRKLPVFMPYPHGPIPGLPKGFLQAVRVFPHPNPNKATISLQKRFIIADPKYFYHKYKPLQVFTVGHELMHYRFHSKTPAQRKNRYIHEHIERQCDDASKNWMLANGYNPTQVSLAIKLLLRGKGRKQCMMMNTTHPRNNNRR